MSSGSIPYNTYHRTQSLGEGSFGSVVTVYNDDGEEFAMKLFAPEDNDGEDEDETLEVGALLEISILRLLRGSNGHPNIIPLADIQCPEADEEEEEGAGTAGCLGMAMPLYPLGSLHQAVQQKSMIQSKQAKICISHGLLSAVHHLHRNGIMHRDIKSDNVVLSQDGSSIKPVLIDFSLVKIVDATMYGDSNNHFPPLTAAQPNEPTPLTGGCGTPMYMAPEVYECEPYGRKADMWSAGVVLLEVFQKNTIPDVKTSQAHTLIKEGLDKLPMDKPFPTVARNLLQMNPDVRWSALQALEYMSQTFPECNDAPSTTIISLKEALPFDDDDEEEEEENVAPPTTPGKKKKKKDPVLERRSRKVRQLCQELECVHPLSIHAAMCYCERMLELDEDLDDLSSSQSMLDCVLLAHKVFEVEVVDMTSLTEDYKSFAEWDLDTYRDNETTLLLMMDYCVYPRQLVDS